jgi:hypothetical protein
MFKRVINTTYYTSVSLGLGDSVHQLLDQSLLNNNNNNLMADGFCYIILVK